VTPAGWFLITCLALAAATGGVVQHNEDQARAAQLHEDQERFRITTGNLNRAIRRVEKVKLGVEQTKGLLSDTAKEQGTQLKATKGVVDDLRGEAGRISRGVHRQAKLAGFVAGQTRRLAAPLRPVSYASVSERSGDAEAQSR
jgi:hypothetical protein